MWQNLEHIFHRESWLQIGSNTAWAAQICYWINSIFLIHYFHKFNNLIAIFCQNMMVDMKKNWFPHDDPI